MIGPVRVAEKVSESAAFLFEKSGGWGVVWCGGVEVRRWGFFFFFSVCVGVWKGDCSLCNPLCLSPLSHSVYLLLFSCLLSLPR